MRPIRDLRPRWQRSKISARLTLCARFARWRKESLLTTLGSDALPQLPFGGEGRAGASGWAERAFGSRQIPWLPEAFLGNSPTLSLSPPSCGLLASHSPRRCALSLAAPSLHTGWHPIHMSFVALQGGDLFALDGAPNQGVHEYHLLHLLLFTAVRAMQDDTAGASSACLSLIDSSASLGWNGGASSSAQGPDFHQILAAPLHWCRAEATEKPRLGTPPCQISQIDTNGR